MELSLILEGGINATVKKHQSVGQLEFIIDENLQFAGFGTQGSELANEVQSQINGLGVVNLEQIRGLYPRLQIADEIAKQQRFMHWELEFADLFYERGGFDLVIGNPPWKNVDWNEQAIIADFNPLFALRNYSATQIVNERREALEKDEVRHRYFKEFEEQDGSKNYYNAVQNYAVLKGHRTNLYKCFIPLSWFLGKQDSGINALVHPKGVYEDAKGSILLREINRRIRKVFRFTNEKGLFHDVHRQTDFTLSIYGQKGEVAFDMVCRLALPEEIDEAYQDSENSSKILSISKDELKLFASIFDAGNSWEEARHPDIQNRYLLEVVKCFGKQTRKISDLQDQSFTTQFWNETIDQNRGIIKENKEGEYSITQFPEFPAESIYSAANFASLNPYGFSTGKRYRNTSDYERVDLMEISDDYLLRCRYHPGVPMDEYQREIPVSPWGKVTDFYRIISREFVGPENERTLTCAIAPRAIAHVNAVFSLTLKNCMDMACLAGCEASVPYDFLVKCIGKRHINQSTYMLFPVFEAEKHLPIVIRTLMMNCLTKYFGELWNKCWHDEYRLDCWAKSDVRLKNSRFTNLTDEWNWNIPLRTDYERRQALVELDVLTAMALGMTLEQLKMIYCIQFPTLKSNESDTWYDRNGRIVFTKSATLRGVGFDRKEWNEIKDAKEGVFTQTITDDTMPGGPVERTIEYVAPFDRCDREKDYEEVWHNFEERFKRC